MQKLFQDHMSSVLQGVSRHLQELGYDKLVIDAGDQEVYFADDQHKPFRPTPLFNYICPLRSEGHLIVLEAGQKPLLYFFQPEDFWYDVQPLASSYWNEEFLIKTLGERKAVWAEVQGLQKVAYIGPNEERAKEFNFDPNPKKLVDRLDWQRSFKTEYEITCLDEAEKIGAKGHIAAKKAFENGQSELEIHQAYMQAIGAVDSELPYWSIIALDEKSAILHYENKRPVRDGKVLLIDSGATYNHYCSDITRTHCLDSAHPVFKTLLDEVNQSQLKLCAAIKPGTPYPDLHHMANVEIFNILSKTDLIKDIDCDAAIEQDVVKTFFPHGLGHMLGIQVHDVGGHLANENGDTLPPPDKYPKLRTTRTLDEGVVLTVEPGLYFIPLLLEKKRESNLKQHFNWKLIDELTPLGGIRIEDNVVVEKDGIRNLTRPYLP